MIQTRWLSYYPGDLIGARMKVHESPQPRGWWKHVLRRDPCCWCGGPSDTVDHVWPKGQRQLAAKLGKLDGIIGTSVGACYECNKSRAGRSVLEFLTIRAKCFSRPRGYDPAVLRPGLRWGTRSWS